MNAILGMTDLALDTPLTEDQRQYLTTVKSSADALLAVINDILDFSKIEAGRLELDRADFSLGSVLGATVRALAVRAHKKGLELVCQQRPGVPDALGGQGQAVDVRHAAIKEYERVRASLSHATPEGSHGRHAVAGGRRLHRIAAQATPPGCAGWWRYHPRSAPARRAALPARREGARQQWSPAGTVEARNGR
jgi:signal transduction histidine kinase